MSKPFRKIMLVTNGPCDTGGAEKTTLDLAQKNDADVLLVDTIRTPFHAGHSPQLSTDVLFEVAVRAKEEYLRKVQTRFVQAGINSTCQVLLTPRTSTGLISTIVEERVDLVVRYMKGSSSRCSGRFGQTAENLMRACPCPVLLTEEVVINPKVVACISLDNGPEENQSILENARRLVSSVEDLQVLCCWEFSGREFLVDYMDEGLYESTKEEVSEMYHQLFDRLQSELVMNDLQDRLILRNESPVSAIPKFCLDNGINVAVMCSASLNHPLGRKLGSTIERVIGKLPCSLLTVKPIGFESSIRPETPLSSNATG